MRNDRHFLKQQYYLAFGATLLALCVVILGAYTRLTDAGLGCPDWPGCYGHLSVPNNTDILKTAVDIKKAWTEMIHRYMAGILGLLIFILGLMAYRGKRQNKQQPLLLPSLLVVLVIFQALLGMWTVTLKLLPAVVMAHLLGGFATVSLLWLLRLRLKALLSANQSSVIITDTDQNKLKMLKITVLISITLAVFQIFLGGWTSANYAALVCLEFPTCQEGQFLIGDVNFLKAYNLFSTGVLGSLGEPLDHISRIAIHMMHRLGALLTSLSILFLCIQAFYLKNKLNKKIQQITYVIMGLLILQITLGIINVLAILPLSIAVSHNAVAVLLLMSLITFSYYLKRKSQF